MLGTIAADGRIDSKAHRKKDGSIQWVEISFNDNNKLVLIVMNDIPSEINLKNPSETLSEMKN